MNAESSTPNEKDTLLVIATLFEALECGVNMAQAEVRLFCWTFLGESAWPMVPSVPVVVVTNIAAPAEVYPTMSNGSTEVRLVGEQIQRSVLFAR